MFLKKRFCFCGNVDISLILLREVRLQIENMWDRKIRPVIQELKVTTRLKEQDERGRMMPRVVVLNPLTLQPYFAYPLHVAAEKLGVCTTSLKR